MTSAIRGGSQCFRWHKADRAFGKSLFLESLSYFCFNMFYFKSVVFVYLGTPPGGMITWQQHFLSIDPVPSMRGDTVSWWEGSLSPWDR